MPYLIYDTETSLVIPASPFPTQESAENHIARMVPNLPNVDTGERFAVIEVPDAT